MLKWEYRMVLHNLSESFTEKQERFKGMSIVEYLDFLGQNGWELLSVTPIANGKYMDDAKTTDLLYTFKHSFTD